MAKIVAVTGCPTGIAHTMMAAEALKKTAQSMGHQLRVETQGAEGVRDALTIEEIEAADVVIVSSDIHVDMSRHQSGHSQRRGDGGAGFCRGHRFGRRG